MSRSTAAACWTFLLACLAVRAADAQNVYQLRDSNTGVTSTVSASEDRLEVSSSGVLYIYHRHARQDRPNGAYYHNDTLDQALLWPHDRGGVLQVRKPGERRFHPSAMQIVWTRPRGGGAPVPPPVARQPVVRSLPAARLKLANTRADELWLVIVDRRVGAPLQMRIAAGSAPTLRFDRDPAGRTLYDVSVYEAIRQSVVIDRTARGRNAVTEENFSPRSVGKFEIPGGARQQDETLDVYRAAARARNPGLVARIDPDDFRLIGPGEVPTALRDPAAVSRAGTPPAPMSGPPQPGPSSYPSGSPPGGEDPDGPFALPGASPAVRQLSDLVVRAPAQGEAPPPEFLFAHVRPAGTGFEAQLIGFASEPFTYQEAVEYTEEVTIDGETKTIVKMRTVEKTAYRDQLELFRLEFAAGDVVAFLANGTPLTGGAFANAIGAGGPVVSLLDGDAIDERLLPLLNPETIILAYGDPNQLQEPERLDPGTAGPEFPQTPLNFLVAIPGEDGGVQLERGEMKEVEEAYTVTVPVTETVTVAGREVTVTKQVEETRTRTVLKAETWFEPLTSEQAHFYTMAGQRLDATAAHANLAAAGLVVFVDVGQKLDPWFRKVLRPDVLLVMRRDR